jgi:hypothetical protein
VAGSDRRGVEATAAGSSRSGAAGRGGAPRTAAGERERVGEGQRPQVAGREGAGEGEEEGPRRCAGARLLPQRARRLLPGRREASSRQARDFFPGGSGGFFPSGPRDPPAAASARELRDRVVPMLRRTEILPPPHQLDRARSGRRNSQELEIEGRWRRPG